PLFPYTTLFRSEAIARPSEGRFHDESVGLQPFCRFGGFAAAQFEVAGVKQRFAFGLEKKLSGAKDMPGRQERNIEIVDVPFFTERQHMLGSFCRQPRLHKSNGALGDDDLRVRRDVVAMLVRHERERLRLPWVEPEMLLRQIGAQ